MSNAVVVSDTTFETEIEKHEGLAVVDFWATWCGPCRMVAPILEQLAVEYEGRAKVAKLDVDANQQTAIRFNVRSIPTILFFKGGKLVDQIIGALPKPADELARDIARLRSAEELAAAEHATWIAERGYERLVLGFERLKLIEQWLDHQRGEKD